MLSKVLRLFVVLGFVFAVSIVAAPLIEFMIDAVSTPEIIELKQVGATQVGDTIYMNYTVTYRGTYVALYNVMCDVYDENGTYITKLEVGDLLPGQTKNITVVMSTEAMNRIANSKYLRNVCRFSIAGLYGIEYEMLVPVVLPTGVGGSGG